VLAVLRVDADFCRLASAMNSREGVAHNLKPAGRTAPLSLLVTARAADSLQALFKRLERFLRNERFGEVA
jgi:hypothetical protein